MTGRFAPTPGDLDRITRALGWRPSAFRRTTTDRGDGPSAARWVVRDDAGNSAFVKVGSRSDIATWTRTEHANYRALSGSFLPKVLGFDDDGERPVLAIEDLSDADWPPPWTDNRVAAVLAALATLHDMDPPAHFKRYAPDQEDDWKQVASDPTALASLGVCSESWLRSALPTLAEAAKNAPVAGDKVAHLDVRSDNLCLLSGRVLLIDWNLAGLANPDLDIAFWLPSLRYEGGPEPEAILPGAPTLAAYVAGFFCSRAARGPLPEAPHVRALQLKQARTALPWAARALGLHPPDGSDVD